MGRFTDHVCKQCRREGEKLFLKGAKCHTAKCPFTRRSYAPGQHGKPVRVVKVSEFALRLREKQKAKRIFGLTERQFRFYFQRASQIKGVTGQKFLELLERRLDNVVYRMGLARSRKEGRTFVSHGHFMVGADSDHRAINVPSYQVRPGEVVRVREGSHEIFRKIVEELEERPCPSWLQLEPKILEGRVLAVPAREEMEGTIDEQLIVEFYSR